MRALLAVADSNLSARIARGLLHEGIDVAIETGVDEARARALRESFDVLIVDVALPGEGGVELCRDLWRRGVQGSIIILIDVDSMAERVRAREAVAHAYVAKPVNVRDLIVQMRAPRLAKRTDTVSNRVVIADLEIDLRTRVVRRGERQIHLTPKEFALLEILAQQPGQPVDRSAIIAHVWNGGTLVGSNMLEVLVRRLRRKIDDGYETKLVRTRRTTGYQLVEQ